MLNDTPRTADDVRLLELTLISSNGKNADLRKIFNTINIYEDIFQHVITGTIQLIDGINLLGDFAVHGNEYLSIKFEKVGLKEKYDKVFRVYKITDREKSPASQTQTYVLHFCSDELVFSNQQSISRSFTGENVSDYVKSICQTDLRVNKNRLAAFDQSKGPSEFVLTRKNPLDAIQYLTENAFGDSNSPFFFYENKNGFNFQSLINLYKNASLGILKYDRAQYTAAPDTSPFDSINKMKNFKFNSTFDMVKATREGLYSSKLYTLDLITQKYTKGEISILDEKTRDVMIDGYFPFNDASNRKNEPVYAAYDSKIRYWLTNKSHSNLPYFISKRVRSNDTYVEEILAQRQMLIETINNTELHCVVPGNPLYSVGFTLDVEMPAFSVDQENQQNYDEYYSGRYLITAVRHVITPNSLQTVMELSKNSVSARISKAAGNSHKVAKLF
jgi:hypothetical protein